MDYMQIATGKSHLTSWYQICDSKKRYKDGQVEIEMLIIALRDFNLKLQNMKVVKYVIVIQPDEICANCNRYNTSNIWCHTCNPQKTAQEWTSRNWMLIIALRDFNLKLQNMKYDRWIPLID